MAYTIKFHDCLNENQLADINTYNIENSDFIIFNFYEEYDLPDPSTSFFMDKSTAIKFAKTLRTEINKIQ